MKKLISLVLISLLSYNAVAQQVVTNFVYVTNTVVVQQPTVYPGQTVVYQPVPTVIYEPSPVIIRSHPYYYYPRPMFHIGIGFGHGYGRGYYGHGFHR